MGNLRLTGATGQDMKIYGTIWVTMKLCGSNYRIEVEAIVTEVDSQNLLIGRRDLQRMNVIGSNFPSQLSESAALIEEFFHTEMLKEADRWPLAEDDIEYECAQSEFEMEEEAAKEMLLEEQQKVRSEVRKYVSEMGAQLIEETSYKDICGMQDMRKLAEKYNDMARNLGWSTDKKLLWLLKEEKVSAHHSEAELEQALERVRAIQEKHEVGWRTIYKDGDKEVLMKALEFKAPLQATIKTGPGSTADITVRLKECQLSSMKDGRAAHTTGGVRYQTQLLPSSPDRQGNLAHHLSCKVGQREPQEVPGETVQQHGRLDKDGIIRIKSKER